MLHILLAALLAGARAEAPGDDTGPAPIADAAPSAPDLARSRWRDAHWDPGVRWDDARLRDEFDPGAGDPDTESSPVLTADGGGAARLFPRHGYDHDDGWDHDGYDDKGWDHDGYDHDDKGWDHDGYDHDDKGWDHDGWDRKRSDHDDGYDDHD